MNENHPAHRLFYTTKDPQSPLPDCPAMTTLLFGVCDNNTQKFNEATRLIGFFMEAAYELGKSHGQRQG